MTSFKRKIGTLGSQDSDNVAITGGSAYGLTLDLPGQFVEYQSNPVLSPEGTEESVAFGSVVAVDSTWYHYYSRYESSKGYVDRAISTDGGVTWARDTDNNPILSPGTTGDWDDKYADVPIVWRDDATHWHMIYRGIKEGLQDQVGYATSSDGIRWNKSESNPIIPYGSGEWDNRNTEATGLIRVGDTVYLWYESQEHNGTVYVRKTGLATANVSDLTSWTKDENNPIFSDHEFCPCVFAIGQYYYMVIPHYSKNTATYIPNDFAELRLYRDTSPTFYADSREFLGIIQRSGAYGEWNSRDIDVPFIVTDDIYRNSFDATNNDLVMFVSGQGDDGNWSIGLSQSQRINGAWQIPHVTLENLSNVLISAPADNEVLAYDETTNTFRNQTPTEAGLLEPNGDGSGLEGVVTAETDPVVGAVDGIVKADGGGNISAAEAGTDYLAPDGDGASLTNVLHNTVEDTTPELGGNLDTKGNTIHFGGESANIHTPSGADPTLTIDLGSGNHHKLNLTSASGTLALTLDAPSGFAGGLIHIKQHASTSVDITIAAASPHTIDWYGDEPDWGGDVAGKRRSISWGYDADDDVILLSVTETN